MRALRKGQRHSEEARRSSDAKTDHAEQLPPIELRCVCSTRSVVALRDSQKEVSSLGRRAAALFRFGHQRFGGG